MKWAPGGTRNRASYPACVACGTSTNPHKAGGLCTRCYMAHSVARRGRWPESVQVCARCHCGNTSASYGGRGMCGPCYRHVLRHGQLSAWPDMRHGTTLAAALVARIGAAAVAAACNVSPAAVARWASGTALPARHRVTVLAILRELDT